MIQKFHHHNADTKIGKSNNNTCITTYKQEEGVMSHARQFECNIEFTEISKGEEPKCMGAIKKIACNACHSVRTKFGRCQRLMCEVICCSLPFVYVIASVLLHLWLAIVIYTYKSDDIVFMCNLDRVKFIVDFVAGLYIFVVLCVIGSEQDLLAIVGGACACSIFLNIGTIVGFIAYCSYTDNLHSPAQYASGYYCSNGNLMKRFTF